LADAVFGLSKIRLYSSAALFLAKPSPDFPEKVFLDFPESAPLHGSTAASLELSNKASSPLFFQTFSYPLPLL
jgi:hypothetical protein